MIDRRQISTEDYGVEDSLQKVSDTDIMLNFLDIIKKLYPNLIKINAHCYDSWDAIIEPVYFTTVFQTFAWKYGIKLDKKNCHIYESEVLTADDKNHIECRPKRYPLSICNSFQERRELSESFLSNRKIVFICFSDGVNVTTGSIAVEAAIQMNFTKVDVRIISDDADKEMTVCDRCFIDIQDIDFEFVVV